METVRCDVLDIEYSSDGKYLLVGTLQGEEYVSYTNPRPMRIRAKVGHFKVSDEEYLRARGFDVEIENDTLLMTVLVNPTLPSYGLKELTGCSSPNLQKEIDKFVWVGLFREIEKYNEEDCRLTWTLYQKYRRRFWHRQEETYRFLLRVQKMLYESTQRGVMVRGVDALRNELQQDYIEQVVWLKQEYRLPESTLTSPTKLLRWLKRYSPDLENTNDETLRLSDLPKELVQRVVKARSLHHQMTHLPQEDGVIHTQYLIHGVSSGRIRSRNPNLQNVQKTARRIFVPREGYRFLEMDYAAAELFVAAFIAVQWGCETHPLLDAYLAGEDLHTRMANKLGGDRQKAKAINFGFLYGMGLERFRQYAYLNFGWEVTTEEAARAQNEYFRMYPEVGFLQRNLKNQQLGPSGRRLPPLPEASHPKRISAVVSGFSSDCLLAGALAWYEKYGLLPVLFVHDSVVYEVQEDTLDGFDWSLYRQPPVPMVEGWKWGSAAFRTSAKLKETW